MMPSGSVLTLITIMVAAPLAVIGVGVIKRTWWAVALAVFGLLVTIASWAALLWLNKAAETGPGSIDEVMIGSVVILTAGGGVILGGILSCCAVIVALFQAFHRESRATVPGTPLPQGKA